MLRFSGLSIISIFSGAMISYQNHSLIRHHHKLFTTTLQLTYLIDENCQIFWKIQNLTFSIYVNTNVMQELVNIEKPCILFFNKTKHIIKHNSMWTTCECFRFFKALCTRGSLMIQYTNLDLKKNLQCIFTSNEMVSTMHIHKWSRKYTNIYIYIYIKIDR